MNIELKTTDTQYLKDQLQASIERRTLAKIVLDSVSPDGVRLTTMEIVIPRIVLAEFNTHRVFSRNSASSRAIPVKKMLQRVNDDPYIPEIWTSNQPGMQGEVITDGNKLALCKMHWLGARDEMVDRVECLLNVGLHKQTTNRLLEPFMWHTIIVTATEWSNFFHLRNHEHAHPAIQRTAACMQKIFETNDPVKVPWGGWHRPYVPLDEHLDERDATKVSAGRCARVSYLTHDGERDPVKDVELHDKLLGNGHMSPLEHVAQCRLHKGERIWFRSEFGNFRPPWVQYRKTIPNEWDVLGVK